jgi:oligopeptide/dipeptide ABC transporter ATP-binding protein
VTVTSDGPVLEVDDLHVVFPARGREGTLVEAVKGVSLRISHGEIVGLVGESGSGKSLTARAVMGLVPESGTVRAARLVLEGRSLLGLPERELRPLRGSRLAMVFQDPMRSLNPVLRIRAQFRQVLRAHGERDPKVADDRAKALLESVGIQDASGSLTRYPHELSGGMQQRVMIAMALSCGPSLLIADEPTTALDATVQAQVLDLIDEKRRQLNLSVLLITHDLGVVENLADRVAVMYAGRIVESGPTRELLDDPKHPYTRALLRSVPRLSAPKNLVPIPGVPALSTDRDVGCAFAPRCSLADERCARERPELRAVEAGHEAACWALERTVVR